MENIDLKDLEKRIENGEDFEVRPDGTIINKESKKPLTFKKNLGANY